MKLRTKRKDATQDQGAAVVSNQKAAKVWTPALVKHGWTPVAGEFLRLYGTMFPQISNSEAMFIVQLVSWKWDEKKPYPGFKTIAARMGISDTQARAHARSLQNKGYLKRVMRTGTTNRFDLSPLFEKLEKEAKDHPRKRPTDFDEE